jgi:microcystin-dependent protein
MGQPYIGEIRMFGGNFPPIDWMFCYGQLLPISEYDSLFTLIGTTYGGDGESTFGLPDLRGRFPMHLGSGYQFSESGGVESVTLTINQIPAHTHTALASNLGGNSDNPSGNFWAANSIKSFGSDAPTLALNAAAITNAGGSQPHDNMHPYLVVSFIISLYGIFPSPT